MNFDLFAIKVALIVCGIIFAVVGIIEIYARLYHKEL